MAANIPAGKPFPLSIIFKCPPPELQSLLVRPNAEDAFLSICEEGLFCFNAENACFVPMWRMSVLS